MDYRRRIIAEFSAQNKAKGAMAGFRRDLQHTVRGIRRMATATLALAGVGGFGYMVKKQMAVIDSTAKLSDRLGIGTESLVAMQHAAKISGVETATLNKSLEVFSRRLGEVDMGVGQARHALDSLGLSYVDLINKSPDSLIGIIADQINQLGTQSQKAAAANYLFGRSGQQLLNLFDQGSAGIREYQREAEKLGITFSRFEAKQVEAANDAMTRLQSAMGGVFRTAAIELAPMVEDLATSFTKWATASGGLSDQLQDAADAIRDNKSTWGWFFETMADGMKEMIRLPETLQAAMTIVDGVRTDDTVSQDAQKLARDLYRRRTGDRDAWTERVIENRGFGPSAFRTVPPEDPELYNRLLKQAEDQLRLRRRINKEREIEQKRIEDAIKTVRRYEGAFPGTEGGATLAGYFGGAGRTGTQQMAAVEGGFVIESEDLAKRHVNIWDRAMDRRTELWGRGLSEMEVRQEKFVSIVASYQDTVERDFVTMWDGFIDGTESAEDALKNFFKRAAIGFLQMQAQMQMMHLWNAGAGAAFNTLGGFVFHGGGIAGKTDVPVRAMPASAFSGAPRLHGGSSEIPAILKRNEHVLTPQQMNDLTGIGRAGGGPVKFNINIENNGQPLEVKDITQTANDNERVINIVVGDIYSGGDMRTGIKDTVERI